MGASYSGLLSSSEPTFSQGPSRRSLEPGFDFQVSRRYESQFTRSLVPQIGDILQIPFVSQREEGILVTFPLTQDVAKCYARRASIAETCLQDLVFLLANQKLHTSTNTSLSVRWMVLFLDCRGLYFTGLGESLTHPY